MSLYLSPKARRSIMGNSKKSKDYDVGYGKPPRSSQFQKGCSGNPKGWPRGSINLNAMLLDPLTRKVQITQGGRTRKVPQVEAFMMLVTKAALRGDAVAGNKMVRMLMKIAQAKALGGNAEVGGNMERHKTAFKTVRILQAIRPAGTPLWPSRRGVLSQGGNSFWRWHGLMG